ncbi:MAG TPA: glutamate-5-semialdehyde dehydrogenase [Clostridiales bacterium]|nr:MAG: Gamma-glutamyl phosphate reductase [Firmicutes bacterium ADurb.Bin262]HOU09641.1 glutamate-5-semialdehyde dehydrogenase [Clostridiales bacterium]HQH62216.1 glutamate-5-semialdehyde dehydrogenase [Clostridiales bacterium]HQK72389.1 glutamate-5-semialdehyde dehydrogenase [Clostridiales bacterium]
MKSIEQLGILAVQAEKVLARASSGLKNKALLACAQALRSGANDILEANRTDLDNSRAAGLSDALLDRLALNEKRIEAMAASIEEIAALPDPVGKIISGGKRPNGLMIQKVRVPLGVIGVIYEARPNVSSDAAALCVKSGNAVILRGGKEALGSNRALTTLLRAALASEGLPEDCVQLVEDTSRSSAAELMRLNQYIDVLIPRGGPGLIRTVVETASVPVIETGAGNCHIYVDKHCDIVMAASIVFNAKTSRPSVCNACESLLVHRGIAAQALPAIAEKLGEKNVEIRGDEAVCAILPSAVPAVEDDWATEYLDLIISVKTVGSAEEAVEHIARYSTGHSECIVTNDYDTALYFTGAVDAAAVYVNASTRFTDGGEFGMGAEIGISTQKLHARGPLGLENLTSEKYIVFGTGQIR